MGIVKWALWSHQGVMFSPVIVFALRQNSDPAMLCAAQQAWQFGEGLANDEYYIPERTPDLAVRGTGKVCNQETIKQFGDGSVFLQEEAASR